VTAPIVHFEILGKDGPGLIDFYRRLFDWTLQVGSLPGWPQYASMESERGIGGAVGSADAAPNGGVLVYVEVDDPRTYIERSLELGASVAMPITYLDDLQLSVAWLRDPEGNLVGLVSRPDGVPTA
jgi:uncharacterized protein